MTWHYVIIAVFAKLGYVQQGSHSTAQHSTAQHSTAQHSTAQHSTAQHAIAPFPPAEQPVQVMLLQPRASASAQNQNPS